jgi:hypothetical protein
LPSTVRQSSSTEVLGRFSEAPAVRVGSNLICSTVSNAETDAATRQVTWKLTVVSTSPMIGPIKMPVW